MNTNIIYQGNCVEVMQKSIDTESIDLTVTSPPYDNLRTYNGYVFDFESIARELWRITKKGGVIVWIVGDQTILGSETGTSFRQALFFMNIGFNLHDTMIYQKSSMVFPETTRYYACFEYMFILSKGKPKTIHLIADRENKAKYTKITGTERKADGTMKVKSGAIAEKYTKEYGVRFNVWMYHTGWGKTYKEEYLKKHSAIMHENLARDHIVSWSNENDIVFDPMCGSGTTLKMAKGLNRRYIGIDISQEYVDISRMRVDGIDTGFLL